jgi:hypothetical protein
LLHLLIWRSLNHANPLVEGQETKNFHRNPYVYVYVYVYVYLCICMCTHTHTHIGSWLQLSSNQLLRTWWILLKAC